MSTQNSIERIPVSLPSDLTVSISRPDKEGLRAVSEIAKNIFIEAIGTTYTQYYQESKSIFSIEKWLQLKEGISFKAWIESVYEGEYNDFLEGKKIFLFLHNANEELIGWATHSPISKNGDLYVSQCCLKSEWRNRKVASQLVSTLLKQKDTISLVFPKMSIIKLITRRINEAANRLYTNSGFTRDEKMDPSIYGDDYDDRYVGFRLEAGLKG